MRHNTLATAVAVGVYMMANEPKPEVAEGSTLANMDAAAAATSAALRAKPKRIRVRSKPLTVEDIVAGAIYVPKRGNNKTPNITVERTSLDSQTRVRTVRYRQRDEVHFCTDSEFLSLVARRINE
jgi:hypothetical protein